jgi:aspartate 1-decarboxylase
MDAANLLPGDKVDPGDLVILIAYGLLDDAEAKGFEPSVVFVDSDNRITGTGTDPAEPLPDGITVRGDEIQPTRTGR